MTSPDGKLKGFAGGLRSALEDSREARFEDGSLAASLTLGGAGVAIESFWGLLWKHFTDISPDPSFRYFAVAVFTIFTLPVAALCIGGIYNNLQLRREQKRVPSK